MPFNTNEYFGLTDFWVSLCSKCSSWVIILVSYEGGRRLNPKAGNTELHFLCGLCTDPETLKEVEALLSTLTINRLFRLSFAPLRQNWVLTAARIV